MTSPQRKLRSPLWLRSLLWLLATVLAMGSMVYQRTTGPTYPRDGHFEVEGVSYEYSLLCSDWSRKTQESTKVSLPAPAGNTVGMLNWRRFPSGDDFTQVPLIRENLDGKERLVGLLPTQPAAGKLEYFLTLQPTSAETLRIPEAGMDKVVIRFKDYVPAGVLAPHVLLMALSILVGLRAGLGALFAPGSMRLWAWLTLIIVTVGGMILGPIVQKYAFGDYWTGWPFGGDWTDNKALFMWLVWMAAALLIGRRPRSREGLSRLVVLLATLAMMAVYLIPHSMGGSELDYSAVDQGLDPSEAIRTGRQ